MNPEARQIVKKMEKAMPPSMEYVNINNPGATHSFLAVEMSRLLVLLAEDAEKSADKLTGQTEKLAEQIKKLLEIADAQKQLAYESAKHTKNLSTQTKLLVRETIILRKFTKGVFWLTVILAILTATLIVIGYLEYSTKAHESIKSGVEQQSEQANGNSKK